MVIMNRTLTGARAALPIRGLAASGVAALGLSVLGLSVLGLAGCATYTVRTDADATLVGSVHCHSVAWAGGFKGDSALRSGIANPLNESRLRDAISANLARAGMTLTDNTAEAECLVGYGIGVNQVVDAVFPDAWGPGMGFGYRGWGPGPWGWGLGWNTGSRVYSQGFIALDLYDNRSHKPMWHATVEQNLVHANGDEAARRIRAAVDALFVKLPR